MTRKTFGWNANGCNDKENQNMSEKIKLVEMFKTRIYLKIKIKFQDV